MRMMRLKLSEEYKTLYPSELAISIVSELFGSLAIVISCLGRIEIAKTAELIK